MLARANRLITADDFRQVMRKGSKLVSNACLTYRIQTAQEHPVRFGFVVGKTVGNAVVRNRIRRRMRAAAHAYSKQHPSGFEFVFRALPGAEELSVAEFERLLVASAVKR